MIASVTTLIGSPYISGGICLLLVGGAAATLSVALSSATRARAAKKGSAGK